ncbi:hypothetical protein Cgig2_022366 [Carnegiea gigantea]|uniref:Fatty acid hydroxylase domain-containing protein n=1 Tax=Carnegiea gigantea TaxID=171969 RepID=A0A9Q1QHA0_9CARY|nr:hypothetical protein Cgig2_022366 [Carnegiea gigantea]
MIGGEDFKALFVEETKFYNRIVLGPILPSAVWEPLPHFLQTWLRCYIGAVHVYLVSALGWSCVIYYWKRNLYVPEDCIPSKRTMLLQIKHAMKAIPWYSLYIAFDEYMVENGWTRCFPRISDVGLQAYLGYVIIYLCLCEVGIYWMHRLLHDIKPLYKYLHAPHHTYNKQNSLSPFAGLALHPIDGILQAAPHTISTFLVPTHFTTHMVLFFMEGLWTASIHDCIHGKLWPVMGAGYHTIHHTTYRHNYGHYTIFMDWLFGTLRTPAVGDEDEPKIS